MELQIKSYLNEIYSEIQECYSDEINLRETDFEKYSIFDFVNFHLIYHYILNDTSTKNDLFIAVPEDEYRENFFASIFHSIVLIKLYQNFFNDRTIVEIATSPNGNRHILSTGYGETSTGTFIEDPGKYAGSNSSRYAEYSQDFSSVFLKYNYLIRLTDHLNIRSQIGIDRRFVSQEYAYEGSYGDHEAVNRIEKFNKFYLLFDISLVYILNNK